MKHKHLSVVCLALVNAAAGFSQITLNTSPSREVGQAKLVPTSANPNLVEGRELWSPQGLALDKSVTPPILYVSDTFNNRVLAWKNATGFTNGLTADLVIGQVDKYCTLAQGPGVATLCTGSALSTGLNTPTGLTVDANGNLYVADSGNNRILRFPRPFSQTGSYPIPDLVIGQPNLNGRSANYTGQVSAQGISLAGFGSFLAFDSFGDLWITDPGNRRVLEFTGPKLAGGNGPQADLELGQIDFTTLQPALNPGVAASRTTTNQFAVPAGIAFDSAGRLYVSDEDSNSPANLSRVLVFVQPFFSGMSATRIMGVIPNLTTATPQNQVDQTLMASPEGIFFLADDSVGVCDTLYNRVLIFAPYAQWPDAATSYSPQAVAVIGQSGSFSSKRANGTQSLTVATPPPNAGSLWGPSAAAFLGTELYIADANNNRVVVMPQQATSPPSFGQATRVLGQDLFSTGAINLIEGREFDFFGAIVQSLPFDAGIVIDSSGSTPHLYVSDPYNNRVLGFKDIRKLTPGANADIVIGQPNYQTNLVNYPTGDPNQLSATSLYRPTGLLVDAQGNLYVADTLNGRVLRFPTPFDHAANEQADLVLGQQSFTSKITDPSSTNMAAPYGLAFTGTNGLLVSDIAHNRVLFFPFSSNGNFTAGNDNGRAATLVFGQPDFVTTKAGSDDASLNAPHLVASDDAGRAYVADSGNGRVEIFADPGTPSTQRTGAHATLTIPGLNAPRAVYVNPTTFEIWVASGAQCLRYPSYNKLIFSLASTATIPAPSTALAIAQDSFGDLLVADATNRVAVYYQGLTAVNGATFFTTQALAPGLVASIVPNPGTTSKFGSKTDTASTTPLPRTLSDVQVLFNGNPTPLYFVSPGQINFYVPMSAPTTGTAELVVQQQSTGQIFGAAQVPMTNVSPGIFVNYNIPAPAGFYYGAVLNQDNTVNTPQNPAARGSVIQIFGTGQGFLANAPADGSVAPGPPNLVTVPDQVRVLIGSCLVASGPTGDLEAPCARQPGDPQVGGWIGYSGLAPFLVGVWQINVYIPMTTPPSSPTTPVALAVVIDSVGSTYPAAPYKVLISVK